MNQKKIMIWALGTISAGEITIAAKFIELLSPSLYDVVYLLTEHYENVLTDNVKRYALKPNEGKRLNQSVILHAIEEFKPDYFFLSDPYTAHFASSWTGFSFFEIKECGISIIGLDEYNCKEYKRKKDYYGGMLVSDRDLIDECDYILQNVPVNPIQKTDKPNVFRYSLIKKEDITVERKTDIRREVNEELGTDKNCKLLMLPVSSWESVNMNRLPILDGFIENIIELLLFYLSQVDSEDSLCLLHVGKQKISYHDQEKLQYRNIPSLDSEMYNKCIVASDVFFSFNAVSVSLSKAVLNNVPSILMLNEKVLNFDKLEETLNKLPEQYQKIAKRIHIVYPYYASTFGWHNFLKPVIEQNSYYELITKVPIFSFSKMKNAIRKALDNEDYGEKIAPYREQLLMLSDPNQIMNDIVNLEGQKEDEDETRNY